jgi:nitrite reductase (NADH) small subunit
MIWFPPASAVEPPDRGPARRIQGMPKFVKMTTLDDLTPGSAVEVEHDGRIYALFHIDGEVWAVDGLCPHQGGPLAEGELRGTIVTCPWHGWQFDVANGRSTLGTRLTQPTFEVRVEGRDILVAVP